MWKQKQWQRRASEMPDDAKHHASVFVRKDAQLGDSNEPQYEPRRGSVVINTVKEIPTVNKMQLKEFGIV